MTRTPAARRAARTVASVDTPQIRELRVGEAELLRVTPVGARHRIEADLGEPLALLDDLEDLVAEPRIHAGGLVHSFDRYEPAQRGFDLEDALRRGNGRRAHELVVVVVVELVLGRCRS